MDHIYLYVVVFSLGGPLAWLVSRRDFRQSLGLSTSGRVRTLSGRAVGLFGIAVLATLFAPMPVQLALAGASGAALLFLILRARPGYGRWRRLPPGPLLPFSQMDRVDDRFLLKESTRHGPVFKTMQSFHPTVCVVGIEAGTNLLRQHDSCLERAGMPFSRLIPQGFIRYMDRNAHARYRPLLAKILAPEVVDRSLPVMATAIDRELRGLEAESGDQGVVLPDRLAGMVLRVFAVLFFGVAQDTEAMNRFERLYGILDCRGLANRSRRESQQALDDLCDLVRAAARSDGNAGYVRALAGEDASLLDDRTLLGNIVCMVQMGAYDVAGLLLWLWKYLSDHPVWQERLRAETSNPTGRSEAGLAERIVSETLRLDQSEFLRRTATAPFDFAGYHVPKNWGVRICVRESHRDAAVFENPEQFDPDRFLRQTYPPRVFSPFGIGRTNCPARGFTYAVTGALLRALAADYTWTVLHEGPRVHDGHHWTPGKAFRVRLSRRQPVP